MSISSILQSDYSISALTPNRPAARPQAAGSRNSGPDTASISEEARQLARQAVENNAETEQAGIESESEKSSSEENASPLRSGGFNLFSLLMDSLFLAQLEDSEEQSQAEQKGLAPRQKGLMQEGDKVAELKKVIDDVMTGKGDISDLPRAMAAGSKKGGSASTPVTQSKSDSTDKNAL